MGILLTEVEPALAARRAAAGKAAAAGSSRFRQGGAAAEPGTPVAKSAAVRLEATLVGAEAEVAVGLVLRRAQTAAGRGWGSTGAAAAAKSDRGRRQTPPLPKRASKGPCCLAACLGRSLRRMCTGTSR